MLLRNGKIKELIAKCYKCQEFYGNKKFRYKCSKCSGYIIPSVLPWNQIEFRNNLNKWTNEKLEYGKSKNIIQLLKKIINNSTSNTIAISYVIKEYQKYFKNMGQEFYISAEEGEELLRRTGIDSCKKSHIICPLVLDWWNMKNFDYKGYELCYYGRFGEPQYHIKAIPPPLPYNSMQSI